MPNGHPRTPGYIVIFGPPPLPGADPPQQNSMMFEGVNAFGPGTAVYVGVAGANGVNGNLILQNTAGPVIRILVDGANVYVGGYGVGGNVRLTDDQGHQEVIFLQADGANVLVGQNGVGGNVRLTDGQGHQEVIFLQADGANVLVGQNGVGGNVRLTDGQGHHEVIFLQADGANVSVGGHGVGGNVRVLDAAGHQAIFLQGDGGNITVAGDITLQAADCAEEFDISGAEDMEPGSVMVLDDYGKLRESTEAYDRKVAGVLSGAGDWRPGIVLDKKQSHKSRRALALVGKVYCKADARLSPIRIGDLLTTSETPGHAMKATEPTRAFGAVIGKALSALPEGRGLIPILVALQ